MALLNEILGVGARYQQLLVRKFGVVNGSPSPQLTPEVSPDYSIMGQPEDRILLQEMLCSGAMGRAAVAGQRSVIQLSVPAGSNYISVLEELHFKVAADGYVGVGFGLNGALASLPAAGGVTYRDGRVQYSGAYSRVPATRLTADTTPPTIFTPNLLYLWQAAAGAYRGPISVVIPPGWAVQVALDAVNTTLYAGFMWREVPLAPGEVGPFS